MINYPTTGGDPRVDFDKNDFDVLIGEKGRSVQLERGLLCPCKSESLNQQSICKNCGGSGYIFINPEKTKMVIQSMNKSTDYKPWSQESTGMINITAFEQDKITFMDRITVLDAESIFNEVLHFKESGGLYYAYTAYPIKKTVYCGLYTSASTVLQKLDPATDFTVSNDAVILNNTFYNPLDTQLKAVTIKYVHAPTYLITDMKRETMDSYEYKLGNRLIRLPLSAIGKRSHYNLTKENLLGNRLLNNSYSTTCQSNTENNC